MSNFLGLAKVEHCDSQRCSVAHLVIWKPSVAIYDLGGSAGRWRLDHLFSELANNIHELLEITRYYLSGSPPCVVNHLESLILSKNMNKYG
jgi:hypothetical protein